MSQFSSRPPFIDTLAVRRDESWYGRQPVTLIRGDQRIEGSRVGRFGGVMVYRPERDIDFGPDRGHSVWNRGMFAELRDEEWERMGWAIVRQYNPTNPLLAALRASQSDPDGYVKSGDISKIDISTGDATPEQRAHMMKVLIRRDRLRDLLAAAPRMDVS